MPNNRLPLIAGNWKMNTTVAEARALANALASNLTARPMRGSPPLPPFHIPHDRRQRDIKGTTLKLGAQNLHPEPKGAFTGEVSPAMLAGLCDYVIVGHSERRALFGEDDDFVNRKLHSALAHDITPILCVGETLAQREANTTEEVLTRQVIGGLKDVPPKPTSLSPTNPSGPSAPAKPPPPPTLSRPLPLSAAPYPNNLANKPLLAPASSTAAASSPPTSATS